MGGELYLQGAQLTVWQPPGERPVLFTSPNSAFATARQFAVASQSSSRGSSPVGTRWRRRSTALRAPHHGISTGRTVGRESLTLTFSLGDSDAEFGSKLLGLHRSFLSQGIIIADCGAATPSRNSAGRGAEDSFGSTADILRLNGRLRVWRSRGGVAASPEEWLVRLSSASRRGGPVDDEGADDVGVAYAND